ncbi:MAG: DoxX family protein [Phycisphaerales bacterium]
MRTLWGSRRAPRRRRSSHERVRFPVHDSVFHLPDQPPAVRSRRPHRVWRPRPRAARAGIGLYMAFGHGYGKLFGGDGLGPSEGFVSGVEELGFPAPLVFAWMAALSEFLGGLALAAGLFTRPAALTLVGTMAVAAFLQHGDDPWTSRGGASKEMAMLYLLPCLGFLALGGGRFSVDSGLRRVLFCKR